MKKEIGKEKMLEIEIDAVIFGTLEQINASNTHSDTPPPLHTPTHEADMEGWYLAIQMAAGAT